MKIFFYAGTPISDSKREDGEDQSEEFNEETAAAEFGIPLKDEVNKAEKVEMMTLHKNHQEYEEPAVICHGVLIISLKHNFRLK